MEKVESKPLQKRLGMKIQKEGIIKIHVRKEHRKVYKNCALLHIRMNPSFASKREVYIKRKAN